MGFSVMAKQICIPTNSMQGLLFFCVFAGTVYRSAFHYKQVCVRSSLWLLIKHFSEYY